MRIWKLVFMVAALFNFAVGLPMLLAPEAMLAQLGQPVPDDLLMTRLASLLIVVLGIGYGMVARDPAANRPILWLGVLGKAPIPLLVWLSGGAAALASSAFMLSLGDLAFAALFLVFLARTPKSAA
ncbi:MAG TPA: hypothetical protein PLO65_11340 [Caulobacter sp.]|nr:hypothetical protein [Caulobacter sp.]